MPRSQVACGLPASATHQSYSLLSMAGLLRAFRPEGKPVSRNCEIGEIGVRPQFLRTVDCTPQVRHEIGDIPRLARGRSAPLAQALARERHDLAPWRELRGKLRRLQHALGDLLGDP